MERDIKHILSQMTLEEKASLCSGEDFWHLKGIERLGIPTIMVTDGPHGLRKQAEKSDHLGINKSVPATCFPTAAATGSSWDIELMHEIGEALAEECLQEDVAVILGPGANIKRSPLCGRNFEYISEDPYLTGEMAAAFIDGVQSRGVGTSLKHYAVNNQEKLRLVMDSVVDDRALREIYLTGFEKAVKQAQPWTVMCSYNKVQGTYASENKKLLTELLKDEWHHDGIVVTDWGACNDRVEGLKAGQELEMPSSGGDNDLRIVRAVKDGILDEEILNAAVGRILKLIFKSADARTPGFTYDAEAHHTLARKAAGQSAVLLKNEGLLPLDKSKKVALIGEFAVKPRYQGGGSSHINPIMMSCAYDEFKNRGIEFTYAQGYSLDSDGVDQSMIGEAVIAATQADVVVLFAGLPDIYESEGYDRGTIDMPQSHNQLISQVSKANPNIVVLLQNGAPVLMPWIHSVKAVIECYLGGQGCGSASGDILYGDVNPSGKLAETFPLALSDTPCYKWFPEGPLTVEYRESVYVGYRYYDTAGKNVLFPFGHGLSYTQFEYSDMRLSAASIQDSDELTVTATIKNTGKVSGAEIVQAYVRDTASTVFRPEKELKGFAKVYLDPGEQKQVLFKLDKRSFAYFNTAINDWHVESGDYTIMLGASSRDIRLSADVHVESTMPHAQIPDYANDTPSYYNIKGKDIGIPDKEFEALLGYPIPPKTRPADAPFDWNATLDDIKHTAIGQRLQQEFLKNMQESFSAADDVSLELIAQNMAAEMPLRSIATFSAGNLTLSKIEGLLIEINKDL